MTDTPWLEIMRSRVGIREVPGRENNPVILKWFADVGHPEIEADEVSWCAVTVGSALVECKEKYGIEFPLPPRDVNMLARSYVKWGRACEPKVGAIVVWPRGTKKWQGHINIVDEVLPDGRVICIGGNQSTGRPEDGVTRTKPMDPKGAVAIRWPVAATVKELRSAGSTEIKHFDQAQGASVAGAIATVAVAAEKVATQPPPVDTEWTTAVTKATEGVGIVQAFSEAVVSLLRVIGAAPWLLCCLAVCVLLWRYGAAGKIGRLARHLMGQPISTQTQPT